MKMVLKAIMFWNDVYDTFPSQRVYDWMSAITEKRVDWFRNYSLTRIAISEHSRRNGFYSQRLYDENMKQLAEIEKNHSDMVNLMQW